MRRVLFFICVACFASGFSPYEVHAKKTFVKLAGSSTVLPIIVRAAEVFSSHNLDIQVMVNPGGSGVAVKSVGHGLVHIGMMSRDILDSEREGFPKAEFETHVIGRDVIACVISSEIRDAGVTTISKENIKKIYLGEINNWIDVGGPDREIVAIDKEFHRGTRHVFMQYLFGQSKVKTPGTDLVTGSNNEQYTKVSLSDSAIGMLSYAWLDNDVVGVGIRDGDDVFNPTKSSIEDNSYPIVRDLTLITNGSATSAANQFIQFLLSPSGQRLVAEMGYLPIQ